MKIKGWKKLSENNKYISYGTIQTKDYNKGQPKHLQVGEQYRFFSTNVIRILAGWKAEDVSKNNMTSKNVIWSVDDYSGKLRGKFKTKAEALKFATAYMKKHPNG